VGLVVAVQPIPINATNSVRNLHDDFAFNTKSGALNLRCRNNFHGEVSLR